MNPAPRSRPCASALPRPASRRGSMAVEEVMALAVVLPVVVAAVTLATRAFVMFNDVVAALTGSPFP